MNNVLIERNLQKQINNVMKQIRSCKDEQFESLVYKYNIFNCIKNTFDEEIVEIENFKELLEEDKNILEKIYSKFLDVNIIFTPKTFDDLMLETFLTEINSNYETIKGERKKEIIDIFKEEYIRKLENEKEKLFNDSQYEFFNESDIYSRVYESLDNDLEQDNEI